MSELQDMLRAQARLHRKQGANALGDLFDNANGEIESLRAQLAKANERVKELAEYKFVHPSNGDSRTVSIDRQFIIDNLVDEIYEKIDCGCEPIGETNVVECECDEYFEQFELLESEQLRKEQE